MTLRSILLLLGALGTLPLIALQQRRALHLLQLEHYENARLFLWLRRRGEMVAWGWVGGRAIPAAAGIALAAVTAPNWALAACVLAQLATTAAEARQHRRRAEIKPLVYTTRARLILAAALIPAAVVMAAGIVLALSGAVGALAAEICLGALVAVTICPALLTAAANNAVKPWQRRVNAGFERAARVTLARIDPRVIGVTGSYGKTTTKVCIGTVLDRRESTLVTPASFNSFLGVVRTINEHLRPEHRDFVVEMGMYRAGDIAELCELTHPSIGVITAIGPAHLERMGSIEAIQDAKAELARALPPDGHLVVNGDDPRCVAIAASVNVPATLYAIENPDADVRALDLRPADGGTSFELVVGQERTTVNAGLLGEHNIQNLLAAAAVGSLVGMTIDEIREGLELTRPPEHRLQPIVNPGTGVVVIDDAYNSNPAGAAAALRVLGEHPATRRILVTPGMVELGEIEDAENERFGALAASVCDHVILVGPNHTAPIRRGLEQGGFDAGAIDVVSDIGGATAVLARLTRPGDVILFENDLPDMYAEQQQRPRANA